MPQVTVSVPNEKLPLLKDVLLAIGINSKKIKNSVSKDSLNKTSTSFHDTATALYQKYLGWEYFCNELEFE